MFSGCRWRQWHPDADCHSKYFELGSLEQQRGIPIALGMCMSLKSPHCRRLVYYDIEGGIPDLDEFCGLA